MTDGRRLENRTRFAVLSATAVVVLLSANGAYRASHLCIADGSWKSSDYYRLVAVKRAMVAYKRSAAPLIETARGKTDSEILTLIAADPTAVVLGKVGFSEYEGRTLEDWLSGAKSKVISLRQGATARGMASYVYVQSDNCGLFSQD